MIVTKNADDYALERIWETGVGSAVTLVVAAFVLPPDPLGDAERRLAATAGALADDLAGARGTLTRGRSLGPRAARRTPTSMRGRPGRAVEDLPRAQRALRFSPLRRGTRPRLDIVDRRQRLALRLAIQVRRLARDFASFAHREDMREQWGSSAKRLPPIIALVEEASAKALAGEGCSHEVAAARELMAGFQREDSRPVTAILRRPLVLLLDELSGPPA